MAVAIFRLYKSPLKKGGALFKDIGNFKVKIIFFLYSMVVYTQMNQFEKCEVDLWLVS